MVQDACGRAVAQELDNAEYRDSRGMSRALTGDKRSDRADDIMQRTDWLAALKAGDKPITEHALKHLREAEQ